MSETERMVEELFAMVQSAQGYAFISDGETYANPRELFDRVRGALSKNDEASAQMRAFLRKHGQPVPRRKAANP